MAFETKSTIAGKPIIGTSPVRWPVRSGTSPVIETFDVLPNHADEIVSNVPVELILKSNNRTVTIKNVFVIHKGPGLNPNVSQVVVVDRRFWWNYAHVHKSYNVRRRVGFRRAGAGEPAELRAVVDRVWYKKFTLKNEENGESNRYTARDILEELFEEVRNAERTETNPEALPGFVIRDSVGAKLKDIPFENEFLRDPLDAAITKILQKIPGADLYIDINGKIIVYSKIDGTEPALITTLGAQIVGRGNATRVPNFVIRPREFHALFEREAELRFDFQEVRSKDVTFGGLGDTRQTQNVLPVPDFTLDITTDAGEADTVTQGTWITVDQALSAWTILPKNSILSNLDHNFLQRAFVPYMDLWTALNMAGVSDPDSDWGARVATLQQHYRQTFRINPEWMDRIKKLMPYRISIVDISSGQRAPAAVYADHAILHTQRSLRRDTLGDADLTYAINVDSYPSGPPRGANPINSDARQAPAIVTILDEDQGIVHLDFRVDPNRVYEMFLPSQIENNPSGDIEDPTANISFNALLEGSTDRPPKLTAEHRVAMILTAVPLSPNSDQGLHRIVVKPSDIRDLLPDGAVIDPANGPIKEKFIGNAVETARSVWSDDRSDDIEAMFGFPKVDPSADAGLKVTDRVKDLVVNHGEASDPSAGASLKEIARAEAARFYASLADRFEGQYSGYLNPGAEPRGWVSDIIHEIDNKGIATSTATFPEKIQQLDMYSFLGDSTRTVLLKFAQG